MTIKTKILLAVWIVIFIVSAVFAYLSNAAQEEEYINGIDKLLYSSALMAKAILPEDYHDNIVDANSVSADDYLKQIDLYNQLCQQIGLQYLWSNLVINNKIVFTSSTSTSKDISNGDHAHFFDVHSNPEAFKGVLQSGETHYPPLKMSGVREEWYSFHF